MVEEGTPLVLGLAIASALSLGVADYLAGATLRRDGRFDTALVYTTIGAVFGAVIVLATLPLAPPDEFTRSDVAWSIAAGVAVGAALPLLMVGMARGPMAVVAPVLGLVSMGVPAVIGPLVGDHLSTLEITGLLLALPAAVLVSLSNHQSESSASTAQAVIIAAAAGALFGSSAIFFGQTNPASGIAPGVVAQTTTTVLLLTVTILSGRMIKPRTEAVGLAAAVGVLTAVAVFLSVLAFQRGPVAVVAAVIGLAPVPTVLMARLLADEEIRPIQIVGFVLGIGAVVLFAMG